MNFTTPSIINIELTNKCNKKCWICGRRKAEKTGAVYNKDVDFDLLKKIAGEVPDNVLVQFHSNGEPMLYPRLKDALLLFKNQIKCFDTNGKLLLEKADEIIDILNTVTISTFENDPEWKEQFEMLQKFLVIKGTRKPNVIIRCLGTIEKERRDLYKNTGCLIANRILHSPDGSFDYEKEVTVPEHGICLEILTHPVINIDGDVSVCVRFDPNKKGILGNIKDRSFDEIWNGEIRNNWIKEHVTGNRNNVPLCKECHFWGVPRGN